METPFKNGHFLIFLIFLKNFEVGGTCKSRFFFKKSRKIAILKNHFFKFAIPCRPTCFVQLLKPFWNFDGKTSNHEFFCLSKKNFFGQYKGSFFDLPTGCKFVNSASRDENPFQKSSKKVFNSENREGGLSRYCKYLPMITQRLPVCFGNWTLWDYIWRNQRSPRRCRIFDF